MKYFTRGYKHVSVKNEVCDLEKFPILTTNTEDDNILQDIFAPDPVTGLPSSDIFVEGRNVNDTLREYIQNVLRTPLSEGSRVDGPDTALNFARGIDESKASYINRIIEITQEGS